MADLITVPTFTFEQGDIFSGDTEVDKPVKILYWNGSIELQQDGGYANPESISIHPKFLNALFKEIKKHLPEAEEHLKRRDKK